MSRINKPLYLIIHHSAVSRKKNPEQFNSIEQYHKQKWNFPSSLGFYGGYQYVIEPSGQIKQARADNDEGAHCYNYNLKSIGICLSGNFDEEMPTFEQISSLVNLLTAKVLEYQIPISSIVPHRKFRKTSCYGKNLEDNWAQKLILNLPLNNNNNNMTKKYSLTKEDGKKILIGLLIALGGAVATYLEDMIPKIDFGQFTAVVVGINSVIINAIRKFLKG